MNKQFLMVLLVIATIPGCLFNRQRPAQRTVINSTSRQNSIDIPVAEHDLKNYFDEDLDELTLVDEPMEIGQNDSDYAWIQESGKDWGFKKIHFGFDEYTIRASEEPALAYDITHMKEHYNKARKEGREVEFAIDAHTDQFGSKTYNYCLAEKRGNTLKQRCIAAGIPASCIKVVSHGSDMPVLVQGKPLVHGDKDQLAPNRRDEVRLVAKAA